MSKNDVNLTVGIEGEKELNQALKEIGAGLKINSAEIKMVTAQFAQNAGSVEALTAKNDVLSKAISSQREKIETLSEALKNSVDATGEASAHSMKLKADYLNAQTAMFKFTNELENSKSALEQAKAATKGEGKALDQMGGEADSAEKKTKNLGKSVKDSGENARQAKSGIGVFELSLTKLVVDGIEKAIGALMRLSDSTREFRKDMSKLNFNAESAGVSLSVTENAMRRLNFITGETDSNVEAISNLLQAGFKDNNMGQVIENLAGAVIRFPDTLKIESLADSLQETIATGEATGQFGEMLERVGVKLESFNKGLEKAVKRGNEQDYILKTLASSGLTEVAQKYEAANQSQKRYADAQYALTSAVAEMAEKVEPLITSVMESVTTALNENGDAIQNVAQIIGAIVNALVFLIATLAQIPAPVYMFIGGIILAVTAINKAKQATESVSKALKVFTEGMSPAKMQTMQLIMIITALAGVLAVLAFLWLAIKEGADKAVVAMSRMQDIQAPKVDVPNNMPKPNMPYSLQGYASGTLSARRGLALVGEQGPEIVAFGGGERVYNANRTKNLLKGDNVESAGTTNYYYATIDAKNVKDFNDVVQAMNQATQNGRAGKWRKRF